MAPQKRYGWNPDEALQEQKEMKEKWVWGDEKTDYEELAKNFEMIDAHDHTAGGVKINNEVPERLYSMSAFPTPEELEEDVVETLIGQIEELAAALMKVQAEMAIMQAQNVQLQQAQVAQKSQDQYYYQQQLWAPGQQQTAIPEPQWAPPLYYGTNTGITTANTVTDGIMNI